MNEGVISLLFLGGFFVFIALCLGIWGFSEWVARQIEARQNRPRLEAEAEAKRVDAERKLEEARIRRLELELGITTSQPQDQLEETA